MHACHWCIDKFELLSMFVISISDSGKSWWLLIIIANSAISFCFLLFILSIVFVPWPSSFLSAYMESTKRQLIANRMEPQRSADIAVIPCWFKWVRIILPHCIAILPLINCRHPICDCRYSALLVASQLMLLWYEPGIAVVGSNYLVIFVKVLVLTVMGVWERLRNSSRTANHSVHIVWYDLHPLLLFHTLRTCMSDLCNICVVSH
jgi:hypothetical protein